MGTTAWVSACVSDIFSRRTRDGMIMRGQCVYRELCYLVWLQYQYTWQSRGGKIRTVGLKVSRAIIYLPRLVYIFVELESPTNRILRDALSKQQEELNSFPPDADGEHTWYCTLPSHISSWSSDMPVCIVVLEVTSACIHCSFHFPGLQLLQKIHSLELTELLLAPRAKISLMYRFSVSQHK